MSSDLPAAGHSSWIDRLGGAVSTTCAVHCLVMAFLPALLPFSGGGEAMEWSFVSIALVFAAVSAALGYRLHRSVPVSYTHLTLPTSG